MIEKVKELMIGKTIASIDFESWQSPNDTMYLNFADGTHIKIMSDPDMCFDGLGFFVLKSRTIKEYEAIK
jgi:hypothetical protein